MEIDIGAAVSVISEKTQKFLFPSAALTHADVKLCTYTLMGQMTIGVKYGGYQGKDTLYVVEGRRCSEGTGFLLLDWIGVAFNSVSHTETKKALETLLDNYSQVLNYIVY